MIFQVCHPLLENAVIERRYGSTIYSTIQTANMRLITFSATLALLSLYSYHAAAQPGIDWLSRYNGPYSKSDMGRAMKKDSVNNIYVVGVTESKSGNRDIVTLKYNSAGALKWSRTYNGTGNGEDWPYAIDVDANGNVYVVGRSIGNNTNYDYATVKYDSSGNQKWARRTSGAGYDVAKDVKADANGNVYVTGYLNGNGVTGGMIGTIKYNAAGDFQWSINYDGTPGTLTEDANSLALDGTGNIYVTGKDVGMITLKYTEVGGNPVQAWVRNDGGSNGQKVLLDPAGDIVVSGWGGTTIKYNAAGDLIWKTVYNGDASFWDMVLDGAGNIYVTGSGRENGPSSDYCTAKYDADGVQQWFVWYNGTKNGVDLARSVAVDGTNNVYVTGQTTIDDGSRNGAVGYGTIKYDQDGNQQWLAFYTGDGFGVETDSDGNVYVTGQSATKSTNFDIVTIKYDATPASRKPKAYPVVINSGLKLINYPNPFYTSTTVEYHVPQFSKVKLTVYDLMGNEVLTLVNENKDAGTYRTNFDARNFSPGMYLYRLQGGGSFITNKFVILK